MSSPGVPSFSPSSATQKAERQLAAAGPHSGPAPARQNLKEHTEKGLMTTTTAPRTGYAPVNGLNMYYEIHGEGRQVIGVELQAHGRTADIDRPLDLDLLAEDTAVFLQYLNIEQADIFGYSNGAAVALRLAV